MISTRGDNQIDIVIMAGGKGSRLGGLPKPLLEICGEKIINRVVRVARELRPRRIFICTRSEYAAYIEDLVTENTEILVCPGRDYVEDLNYVFTKTIFPVLVLPSDTPFITSNLLRRFLEKALEMSIPIINLIRCSEDKCVETGVSLFHEPRGEWFNVIFPDTPELRDIDVPEDLEWAEGLCEYTEEIEKRE